MKNLILIVCCFLVFSCVLKENKRELLKEVMDIGKEFYFNIFINEIRSKRDYDKYILDSIY